MPSQELQLAVAGLVTSPNPFGASPSGSLFLADDCVVRDAGILESRRGFDQQSLLSGGSRLSSYQSKLIGLSNSTLNYYDAGWHALSGSYSGPDAAMRFLQAAKNFYFTTSGGTYKMDAYNATPVLSGLPRPRSIENTASYTGANGWLPSTAKVNYWVVYGAYDSNKNLILGEPSNPVTLYNFTGGTVCPVLTLSCVPSLSAYGNAFVRLYRSNYATSGEPLAEGFLAVEIALADLAAPASITDQTPVQALGAALYTNATQEGAGQSNSRPPMARDLCAFKGYVLAGNTTDYQRLTLKLQLIGGPNGLVIGDTIVIDGVTYTASAAENLAGHNFELFPNSLTTTARIATTLDSLVRCVLYTNQSPYAYYLDAGCAPDTNSNPATAGSLLLEGLAPGEPEFVVTFGATVYNLSIGSLVRTGGGLVTVSQAAHPYVVGATVTIGAGTDVNFPVGQKVVWSVPDVNHWVYLESGVDAASTTPYTATHYQTGSAWQKQASYTSSDSREPAGIRCCKFNQPDAAPLEDDFIAGDSSADLLRILALRDSVLIFKTDGIFRLTGNSPADFAIQPYDLTTFVTAPESVAALSDTAFAWTSKGVWIYGESSGGQSISRAIDETLFELQAAFVATSATAFAVAYEAEQQYLLWVPESAAENPGFPYTLPITFGAGVLPGGQAFVFNARTNTWTRYTTPAAHGIVDPASGKLTLVNGGQVLQERKDLTAEDYQDVGGSANITLVTDPTHITMIGPAVGDLVTQGVYSAHVLSVDPSNVLTLDTAGTWSVASADYARAINCVAQWLPAAGENPGTVKQFREVSLNFRLGQFSWITAGFASDITPTQETVLRYGTPATPLSVNVRTLVPINMARATQLSVAFQHQQALCNFQLQSASLIYRSVSTRTPSRGAP